jgi:CRISPR-associated exonuclease Cas4
VVLRIVLLLSLAVVLLLMGLVLLWRSKRKRGETGLPQGRVVYDDTGAWQVCPRPLFSRRYLLAGKPDYIVAQGNYLVPVEVKPRRTAARPYLSDILQLAAYCLLIEDNFDKAPPYGIIKYAARTFPVEYTPELRRRLLATMEGMRRDLITAEVAPSHKNAQRCRACGHREQCQARVEETAESALV